jgi:hypothetical protein
MRIEIDPSSEDQPDSSEYREDLVQECPTERHEFPSLSNQKAAPKNVTMPNIPKITEVADHSCA